MDIFLHSCTEILHGWKIHDYLMDCERRFKARKVRWKMDEGKEGVRMSLVENFRTIDQHCFSPQYFFSVSFHVSGIFLAVFGCEFVFKSGMSPFSDILTLPLPIMCIIFIKIFQKPAEKLVLNKLKLWEVKVPEVIPKREVDIVSDKLAELKEFSQEDLQTVVSTAFNHAYGLESFGSKDKKIVDHTEGADEIVNEDAVKQMGFKASGGGGKATSAVIPQWPDELMDGALYDLGGQDAGLIKEEDENDFQEFGVDPAQENKGVAEGALEFDFSEFTFDQMLENEEAEDHAKFEENKDDLFALGNDAGSDDDSDDAEDWPDELAF